MENKFYLSKEDYNKGISLMIRFCMDFAVVKDGKLLLTKRLIEPYKGMWNLPGGMVKKGEPMKEATERILTSELGLKSVSTELVGYIEYLDEKLLEKGISTHSVSLVFKTVLEDGELKESFQAKEFTFFSEPPDSTIPPLKEFLQKHKDLLR
jgi:8-oxo-dGTP diphosphatase